MFYLICHQRCSSILGKAGETCSLDSECHPDHCCALNVNLEGVCQPYLTEGENCGSNPFSSLFGNDDMKEAITGLPSKCPCRTGLKCQKTS